MGAALICTSSLIAQEIPEPTGAVERQIAHERRLASQDDNPLGGLVFQSIGPTIMGGRVTDLEVSPKDPTEFYVAYASGGLFHTVNNGQTYTSLFDHEMVMTIGDIAVDWERNRIWIGTGENNSSRSSYSGFGMYLSEDGGKTWQHKGLEESHHIGRVILHPDDPKTLWVAVLGHLYSPNEERGVYKTSDGGMTWEKVLYVNENTGAVDMVIHPKNPNVLYAAMWHRERRAWNFVESGSESGIHKSKDGGATWELISGEGSGFAFGQGLGRIGLAITSDGKVIYALLDNQNRRPEDDKKKEGLQKKELRTMSKEKFLSLPKKNLEDFLKKNDFPKEFTADSILTLIRVDEIKPHHLVDYLEDSNRNLFDTDVIGAEVYARYDEGDYWVRTHEKFIDDLVYTYGYYFGQIRVSTTDNLKIFITGVPILKSSDGGKTFETINGDNQHVDHHALWVSPWKEGHLINGNDGGINISYDDGKNWMKVNSPPVGQFYTVSVDYDKPYNVYGGLQDNGVWVGPSTYKEGTSWQSVGQYPYKRIMGGDGFQVAVDRRDNKTVYTGYQFGHYYRFNKDGGKRTKVTPRHMLGERPLRFNWQSPIHLSVHNQDVFYFGSNKFHRSLTQGNSYDVTSHDLTSGGKKGDVSFGTLTTIHESPMKFGLIYLGTDDGHVYRSDDLGYHWHKIDGDLPENMWVSRVQASAHDTGRVYLTLNGYRWDHFDAYVFVSEDFGKNWKRIGIGLPREPVNVIKEDPVNENILYLGTDHGLYISMDRGGKFHYISQIPSVSVHDLAIQERDKDLLVGTHGRSIYKVSIKELQMLNEEMMAKGIHLFALPSVKYSKNWGKKMNNWKKAYEPEVRIPVYMQERGLAHAEIYFKEKLVAKYDADTLEKGLNYLKIDLSINEPYVDQIRKLYSMSKKKGEELEQAENDKYYLLAGDYKVRVLGSPGLKAPKVAKWVSDEQKLTIKGEKK